MSIAGKYIIAGVGNTKYGKLPGRSSESLTVEAIRNAIQDAGIDKSQVDAVLTKAPTSNFELLYSTRISEHLGIVPKVTATIDNAGASTASALVYGAMCIEEGLCSVAVVSYGDNPLTGSRDVYAKPAGDTDAYGMFGAVSGYAMITQRYLHKFNKTSVNLAPIPIGDRKWASMNPNALFQKPITLDDHQSSRFVAEPLHLLDCCPVTDGAAAAVIMSAERAKDLPKAPVYLNGFGQGHTAWELVTREHYTTSGALQSGKVAFQMAGITPRNVDFLELYGPFSVVPIITLEDYGFCKKGEGCDFVADNKTHPGGALPMNTSGGLLSETGMPGMQLIVEAVRQLRGECGQRQVPKHDVTVVSNQGGHMTTHSTLVLGTHPR
ncbi:MAG: thiolase family protein [Candidatus Lambdaproteobacteria bacterium]|nr:thiolase family protein [Candidatus Lambdaproteobacteria bacterium]